MKKKEFNIALYTVSFQDGSIVAKKLSDGLIIGKNLFTKNVLDDFEINDKSLYNQFPFDYHYNVPFDLNIESKNKKLRKLNVTITYSIAINDKCFQTAFTSLNVYQKALNSLHFNRLWIQQPMNIMWLTNIIIIILLGLINLFKN